MSSAYAIESVEGTRFLPTHAVYTQGALRSFMDMLDTNDRPIFPPQPAAAMARPTAFDTWAESCAYVGHDIGGMQLWSDPYLTSPSAGYGGVYVGDFLNGLEVYTGTPSLRIMPETAPLSLTGSISFIWYGAVVLAYPSAFQIVGGEAYPLSPSFADS